MDATIPPPPHLSLVVNTCDRQGPLQTLLRSLHQQTYRHFEVVVVVGPTRDDSLGMLEREFPPDGRRGRVRVVRCPEFNLSVSRNLGLAHAAGDVVAFVDDDAVPCPTWFEQLALGFDDDPELAGLGGRTFNVTNGEVQFDRGRISALGQQEDRAGVAPHLFSTLAPDRTWFPRLHGCNMAYRRSALCEIDGFDERFEYLFDDADLGAELGKRGLRIEHSPATVYHRPGTGRNRGKATYDLNWTSWVRSTIYFVFQNGRGVVRFRDRVAWALRHTRSFYARVAEARRHGHLPGRLFWKAQLGLARGTIGGFAQGLLLPRRKRPVPPPQGEFLPFQGEDSRAAEHCPRVAPDSPPEVFEPLTDKLSEPRSERPLSLALLSLEYPPKSTHGVARYSEALARHLALRGHEVHVVTGGHERTCRSRDGYYLHTAPVRERARYRRLAAQGYPNLCHWLEHSHAASEVVGELERDHRLDIVDAPLWLLEGLVPAIAATTPVVVRVVTAMRQIAGIHARGTEASEPVEEVSPEERLLGDLEQCFLERARGCLVNVRGGVETLREVYGIENRQDRIQVVPLGIDSLPEKEVVHLTERRRDRVSVLFVGRLERRKGIRELLAAIPPLSTRFPSAEFVIAGRDNSREDGFFEREKREYADAFGRAHPGLRDQVHFFGHVSDRRLQELYRECDVFVAPSLYESFGLVFLEAMNHARPVVACGAGGALEIVSPGETGLLVEPGDAAALTDALSRLLDERELRERLGEAGRIRLLDHYTAERMAARTAAAYRRWLAVPSSEGREQGA